jgi:outer membrane lipoprotein-sorting protein
MNPLKTALFGVLLAGAPAFAADPPTPAEVLAKADQVQLPETAHMVMEQTIRTTSGNTRTFRIESWSNGSGEKSIMRFLSPAPSAGIGMLSLDHGDNIWAYFPDSDDLRKIASSARNSSMEGSDFSYEDMAGGEMGRTWEATALSVEELDGRPCYRLDLVPLKSSSYSRAVTWVDQERFTTPKVDFFDKKDRHVKRLTMAGWNEVSGIWTPTEMVMENLKRGGQTSIRILEVRYGIPVDDAKFTTQFLTAI